MTDLMSSGEQSLPEGRLGIDTERQATCVVFHVRGDVDYESASRFRDKVIATVAGDSPPRAVLDLAKVTFSDSSCMGALVAIWKAANARSGAVVLACVPEQTRRLLSYTGLDTRLTIRETVADAVSAVAA